MPRKPRREEAGAFHHVWARGDNREVVFRDNGDRQVLLVVLKGVVDLCQWQLLAYCLMGNHFHLVVMTPVPNLGYGMQRLNSTYGTHVNRRYGRSGPPGGGHVGACHHSPS
jgi:REP-associated tyrosine transposase